MHPLLLSLFAFGVPQFYTGIVERCDVTGVPYPDFEMTVTYQTVTTNTNNITVGGVSVTVINLEPVINSVTVTNFDPVVTNGLTIYPEPNWETIRELDKVLMQLSFYFVNTNLGDQAGWLTQTNRDSMSGYPSVYTENFPRYNPPTMFEAASIGDWDGAPSTNAAGEVLVYYTTSSDALWYRMTRWENQTNAIVGEWHYTGAWVRVDSGIAIDYGTGTAGDYHIDQGYYEENFGWMTATNICPVIQYQPGVSTNPVSTGTVTIAGEYFDAHMSNPSWPWVVSTSTNGVTNTIGYAATHPWRDITSVTISAPSANTGDVIRVVYTNALDFYGNHPAEIYSNDYRLVERETLLGMMTHTVADDVSTTYEYTWSDPFGSGHGTSTVSGVHGWSYNVDLDNGTYLYKWSDDCTITALIPATNLITAATLYIGTEPAIWPWWGSDVDLPFGGGWGTTNAPQWMVQETNSPGASATNTTFTQLTASYGPLTAFTNPEDTTTVHKGSGCKLLGLVLFEWNFTEP